VVKWSPSLKKGQAAYVPGLVYHGGSRSGATAIFNPTQRFNPKLPGAMAAATAAPLASVSSASDGSAGETLAGAAAAAAASASASLRPAGGKFAPAVSLGDMVAAGRAFRGDGAMGLRRVLVDRPPALQVNRRLDLSLSSSFPPSRSLSFFYSWHF
jgi:hypothetical protein